MRGCHLLRAYGASLARQRQSDDGLFQSIKCARAHSAQLSAVSARSDEEPIDRRIYVGSGPAQLPALVSAQCTKHAYRRATRSRAPARALALRKSPPMWCSSNSALPLLHQRPTQPQGEGHGSALYELALNGGRRNVGGAKTSREATYERGHRGRQARSEWCNVNFSATAGNGAHHRVGNLCGSHQSGQWVRRRTGLRPHARVRDEGRIDDGDIDLSAAQLLAQGQTEAAQAKLRRCTPTPAPPAFCCAWTQPLLARALPANARSDACAGGRDWTRPLRNVGGGTVVKGAEPHLFSW